MPDAGAADEVREVQPGGWLAALSAARDEGFGFFDFLSAVDEIGRADQFRVVCRLVDPDAEPLRAVQLHTRIPRETPVLAGAQGLFAGAAWHQRETHDLFGIEFTGADLAPLLVHEPGLFPLRKDFVLGARAATPWPGAKEPGESAAAPSRRKMVPPGVPDPQVWGDRDPSAEAPAADEVAAAVAGGRVRRRR